MGNFNPNAAMLMNGVQRGPGSTGPQGGGYAPVPTQAQSAPPATGASIAAGIADFLTNYQRGRQADKDRNKSDFMNDVQLMMLGIPVDHTKMAKKAKMAGIDLDFEGSNAPAMMQQAENQQIGQQQGQAIEGQTNAMATDATQQMLMNGMQQPTSRPPSELVNPMMRQTNGGDWEEQRQRPLPPSAPGGTGLMSRIGQGMGYTAGPINPDSSGMQWLQELAAQGKKTKEMGTEEQRQGEQMQKVRAGMLDIYQKAVTGDPHAMELVSRFPKETGMRLEQLPFDGLLALGRNSGQSDAKTSQAILFHALGGEQALQHVREMAEKFAPHFGGDLGKAMQYVQETLSTGRSGLRPAMSLEQQVKVMDFADRFAEKYPMMPMNMAMTYANLKASGNDGAAGTILDYASSNYKRTKSIDQENFNTTNQYHRDALNQAAAIHSDTINLAIQRALIDATGDDGKLGWEMMNGKNATDQTVQTGAEMVAAAASKRKDITVNFKGANGKKQAFTLGAGTITADKVANWFTKNQADFKFKPDDLSQFTGAPQSKEGSKVMETLGVAMKKAREMVEAQILADLPVN